MVFSSYTKERILLFRRLGKKAPTIQKLLAKEGLVVSRVGVCKFLKRFQRTGSLLRQYGSGTSSKVNDDALALIEQEMRNNDETTAKELQSKLESEGHRLSQPSILRWRRELGWTYGGTKYCQMIRAVNKVKRLDWAKNNENNLSFDNVVFTDETSVQIETHRRFCCYKRGRKPRYKPKLFAALDISRR